MSRVRKWPQNFSCELFKVHNGCKEWLKLHYENFICKKLFLSRNENKAGGQPLSGLLVCHIGNGHLSMAKINLPATSSILGGLGSLPRNFGHLKSLRLMTVLMLCQNLYSTCTLPMIIYTEL